MSPRVFISYSHAQHDWVRNRLFHVIRASGAEPTLDVVDGTAGRAFDAQMADWTDNADIVAAVLSPEYVNSKACRFEWNRALAKDPGFLKGRAVIPILRADCRLPAALRTANPLYLDLRDKPGESPLSPDKERAWGKLLEAWDGTLGCRITDWLHALEEVVRFLAADESVNLVATGDVRWRALIEAAGQRLDGLPSVDLGDPLVRKRPRFLMALLKAVGLSPGDLTKLSDGEDVVAFSQILRESPPVRVAIRHFSDCADCSGFDAEFFNALRHHRTDDKVRVDGRERNRLTFLVHTTRPFATLLPPDRQPSWADCKGVFLRHGG